MEAEIVAEVLRKGSSRAYKSITVEKHVEPYMDLGTLLLVDNDDLDSKTFASKKDEYLLNLTRDNTQYLFNKIWELPTERKDEAIVVTLPDSKFTLPRSQKVPKPKPLTKWQEFAKQKGIVKKKKEKTTWDEELQKWVPLYGYKKAAAQNDKDWVLEVPQNADPMTDMFAQKTEAKKENVAKNELQRLKNIARAQKVKIPRVGFPTTSDKASSTQLSAAITVARSSTASAGKFQPRLPKEKDARGKEVSGLISDAGKKRKAHIPDVETEKKKNLEIMSSILKKQPKIDANLAVTKQINLEQKERSEEKKQGKSKGKVSKKSKQSFKGSKSKKGAKPSGGKGQRNPNKRNIGRKRR